MIDSFLEVFSILNLRVVLLSALLFFIGYAFAPTAYFKEIKWLTSYPFFIIKIMDEHLKKDWNPALIFLTILFLNSFSLFLNLLSGWIAILPYLVIIYMGLNVGVVAYHTLEGKFYYASLINPVAILELLASWISVAMAIQFSLARISDGDWFKVIPFQNYMGYFLQTIIPVLIIAALIETGLILVLRKRESEED